MDENRCEIFDQWLERLPRREPSPRFMEHLEGCDTCRKFYEMLDPVAEKLLKTPVSPDLDPERISELTRVAQYSLIRLESSKIAVRISTLSFLLLPVVIAINFAWGYAGYELFAWLISPLAGKTFVIIFTSMAATILSVMYSGIPLLAGWLRGPALEDTYQ